MANYTFLSEEWCFMGNTRRGKALRTHLLKGASFGSKVKYKALERVPFSLLVALGTFYISTY